MVSKPAVDRFGDHLLGCGHGPMRIRRHDALCDIVFHHAALLQDNSGCRRGSSVVAVLWIALGMFTTLTFCMVSQLISMLLCMRNPLQDSLLSQSAVTAGVCRIAGARWRRNARHEEAVFGAGGIFIPLAVETLGLWSPASLSVLRDIALRTTTRSGAGIALACCHFIEQLSVCLWRHNSRMFLHHFSLFPVSPLWELCPEMDSPAHGFCHPEPLHAWACNYFILYSPGGFCHSVLSPGKIRSPRLMFRSVPGGFCHSEPPGELHCQDMADFILRSQELVPAMDL